jgi:hypothetical protein
MNTAEFKNLTYDIVPNLQKKLDRIGNGNAVVVIQDELQRSGVFYVGISGDDNTPPYETYLVRFENSPMTGHNDTVYWDFAGYSN